MAETAEGGSRGAARWAAPPQRPRWGTAVFCGAGAVATLGVPFLLPMQDRLSASYLYGFSNRGALLLFLLFAVSFAWWHGPTVGGASETANTAGEVSVPAEGLSVRSLGWGLAVSLLLTGVVWGLAARSGPRHESLYLLERLAHLRAGQRIYQDFEFAYGPLLLYLPLWASRGVGVSLTAAYFGTLLVESAAGVALLWGTVRLVMAGERHAAAVFGLLLAAPMSWLLLFGANYTLFRFALAPFVAVAGWRLAERGRRGWAAAVLFAGTAVAFAFSPEQGLALMAGAALFAMMFVGGGGAWGRAGGTLWAGLAGYVAMGGGLVLWAWRMGAFGTPGAMAAGGYALPVLPSLHLPVILGLVVVALGATVEAVRRRAGPTAGLALVCLGVFLLPAAFGRADEVHLLANGLPLLLAGMAAVARDRRLWWWASRGFAGLVLLPAVPLMLLNVRWLATVARQSDAAARQPVVVLGPEAMTRITGAMPRGRALYAPFGPLDAPAGVLPPVWLGRFYGVENLISAAQVRAKVEEMEGLGGAPMLLPRALACVPFGGRGTVMVQTMGLLALRPRHAPTTMEPVCQYLRAHYRMVPLAGTEDAVAVPVTRRSVAGSDR